MRPPLKKVKRDEFEPPPLNQLAIVNARAKSVAARPRAQAVAGTKRRPRNPLKKVKILENFPLDILYEVFSYLHPRDLLNLTRTNTGLRTILTQDDCAFVWRASRALVGLLDPTECLGISEVAFASVLFSNHCRSCGKVVANCKILWPIPVVYCSSCKKLNFREAADRVEAVAEIVGFEVKDLVLFNRMDEDYAQVWHLPQLEKIEAKLVSLPGMDEKRRYVQAQLDYVAAWKEYAPVLEVWMQGYREQMKVEANEARRKRCVAAMAKLRAEGLDLEVDMMTCDELDQFASQRQLTLRGELTDQAWGKIQRVVADFVTNLRESPQPGEKPRFRLRWRMRLVERALRQYRRSKDGEGAERERVGGLRFGDVVAMPAIRALLEDDSPDLTRDLLLTHLADMIPSLSVDWHKECKSRLVSIAEADLKKTAGPFSDGSLTVDLAIMSFRCNGCRSVLRWPEVLGHVCLRDADLDEHPPPAGQVYETEAWQYLQEIGWDQGKWNSRNGRLPALRLVEPALAVITACGLDPATATAEEMDEHGARFYWHDASDPRREKRHSQEGHGHWIRLPEDLAAQARALESAVEQTQHVCTWCYYSSDITHVRQHVQLHHEKGSPRSGEDYYCREKRMGRVAMYSENLRMVDLDAQEQVEAGRAFFARF
ncbi:hypothetical protein GSI_01573 [Ganoderma sinense ZZ0214-1]|uniref:F-box domain-containing protein n=1 Tax=Ganoderma sinense ZZ0214-1 TaxID=1077348 RepID=A0A2G8SQB9_9APHY|nr:hypothetical protein GSI_01573 [Ganoderma sinense ZZ0214-1]